MFSWTEKELNEEQSEVVHLPGSVLLMACPGSGKTRTLTYKIAYELSRLESDPRFVVAITYTHRAADEIRERVEQLGVDTQKLWIGTIHSFCLEWIIKPYGIYEPALAHGYLVIDQHERELLLDRLCKPYSHLRLSSYDCDYYFTKQGYLLGCPDNNKHASIHEVLKSYFAALNESRKIDFELILWHASSLIEKNTAIRRLLSELFAIVLVDEYQDTKDIQYSILGSILSAGNGSVRLFMVGDPNQAIYGSLGGYPIELDSLRRITGLQIGKRELSINYRSSSRIVSFFSNFNVYKTTIQAGGKDRDFPSSITYNRLAGRDDLVGEIAKIIRYAVQEAGASPSEICVLAPQWFPLASMTRHLVSSLPEYHFNGPGMVPFARDTENFWYKLARIALTNPSPSNYMRRVRWANESIADMSNAGIDVSDMSSKALLRNINSIDVNDENGLSYLNKVFDALFKTLGIRIDDFPQLRDHHTAFFDSSRSRVARLQGEGLEGVADTSFFKKVFEGRRGITMSTIHGVKGGEFDVVIAYALLEGMVPHFNDPDADTSARKIIYVVGSRARKHLHLFSETDRPRGRFSVYGPTRVLADCVFSYDAE